MKYLPLLLVALLLGAVACAAPVDPVFPDVKALYSTPVDAQVLKSSEKDGIVTEEVRFHCEMDGDKSVDTFGYFVYPKGAQGLPAVIWNQSGLAPADTNLVNYGVKRGYAMFCFDYPNLGGGYRSTMHYMINSTLVLTDDIRQAPIAHGAIAALKAVSFLQSRPEVDKARIGMAGNSWGGFFSTLMAGLDPRLKACAASFGTGSLQLGCAWFRGAPDAAIAERWGTTLDPGWRLAYSKTPILWVSATNDNFYWMPSLMQSYALAAGPKHLSIAANYDHDAPRAFGEQFDWLDIYLQGKPGFTTVTPLKVTRHGRKLIARWSFSSPPERKVTSAEVALSYGAPGNWRCRAWRILPATITGTTCRVTLPDSPLPYYITGATIDTYRHSTPLVYVDPKKYSVLKKQADMPVDGCVMWGGFEPNQIGFLAGQGFPMPATSLDARMGKQAAILPAGKTTNFARLYFIAGLPHRLTCYLKAEKPTTVTLSLTELYDKNERMRENTVAVGTEWTPVTLDFPTAAGMYTDMPFTVTVPVGAAVLMDDLSFCPIMSGK